MRETGLAEGRAEGKAQGIIEGRAEGLAKGRIEGLAKGRAEGERKTKIDMAKKLLENNIAKEIILSTTGLTEEELNNIDNLEQLFINKKNFK